MRTETKCAATRGKLQKAAAERNHTSLQWMQTSGQQGLAEDFWSIQYRFYFGQTMAESNNMWSLEALPPSSVKITLYCYLSPQQLPTCPWQGPDHAEVVLERWHFAHCFIFVPGDVLNLEIKLIPYIPLFLWRLWIETPWMMNQMQLSLPSYCARLDLRSQYSQAGMENLNLTSPGHKHQINIIAGFYWARDYKTIQNLHLFGNLGIFFCSKADTTMKYPSDWSSVRALGPKVPSTPLSISQRKMSQENARAQHGLNFLKSRNGYYMFIASTLDTW